MPSRSTHGPTRNAHSTAATAGVTPGDRNLLSRPSRRSTRQAMLTIVKTPSSSSAVTEARLTTMSSSARLATYTMSASASTVEKITPTYGERRLGETLPSVRGSTSWWARP